VAVVKEQIALDSVATAKRPFTVAVYAVSGIGRRTGKRRATR